MKNIKKILVGAVLALIPGLAHGQFLGPPTAYSRVVADTLSDTSLAIVQVPSYGGSNSVKIRSITMTELAKKMNSSGGNIDADTINAHVGVFDTLSCTTCYFIDTTSNIRDTVNNMLRAGVDTLRVQGDGPFFAINATPSSLEVQVPATFTAGVDVTNGNALTADTADVVALTGTRAALDSIHTRALVSQGGVDEAGGMYAIGDNGSSNFNNWFVGAPGDSSYTLFSKATGGYVSKLKVYKDSVKSLVTLRAPTIAGDSIHTRALKVTGVLNGTSASFDGFNTSTTQANVTATDEFIVGSDSSEYQCFGPDQCVIRSSLSNQTAGSDVPWSFTAPDTHDSVTTRALTVTGKTHLGGLFEKTFVSQFETGSIDTITATDSTNTVVCQNIDGCFIDISSLQSIGRVVTLTQLTGDDSFNFRTTADVYWSENVLMTAGEMGVSCGDNLAGQHLLQSVTLTYIDTGVWMMKGSILGVGTCDP